MIQKNKSQRIVLFKYILSAPLFGLMLILSSATINNSKAVKAIHLKASNIFSEAATNTITAITEQGKIPALPVDERPTAIDQKSNIANNNTTNALMEQDTTHDKIYETVEHQPNFPGGIDKFYTFLAQSIKYPAGARKDSIQGKVFIQFVIEKDGSLSNIKAVRGPGHGLNEEAVRAIGTSPKWIAGIQDGKAVRVEYTIPVNFTLNTQNIRVTNIVLHPPGSANTTTTPNTVYGSVEKEPNYPGGIEAFYKFLAQTIKYPADARRDKIQGKVFIQFVVEKDGSLTDIKAIRAPSPSIGEEAVRVVGLSPKWIAGTQNGQTVRVQYTVPVNFSLSQ